MLIHTKALVLKRRYYSQSSLIVVLCTPGIGKIYAIAKGVLRPKSDFRTNLDIFSLNDVIIYEKKYGLSIVREADLLDDFKGITNNYKIFMIAGKVLNLCSKGSGFRHESQRLMQLVCMSLGTLANDVVDPKWILDIFMSKYCFLMGLFPQIEGCVLCKQDINWHAEKQAFFSMHMGGSVCKYCLRKVSDAKAVDPLSIRGLLHFRNKQFKDLISLKVPDSVRDNIRSLLREHLMFHGGYL